MNVELMKKIEECMNLCTMIENMTEEDINEYQVFLGGDILSGYRHASETAKGRAAQIRSELEKLYSEASKES